ncbi:MAG: SDR family NAD(P)-dependent oxidoreductase [Betaproteobacteria bacterium]
MATHPSLFNRTVLVTGGGRGIGRSFALALAAEGARVAICGRDANTLAATAEKLKEKGARAVLAVTGDVSQPDDCSRIVDRVAQTFGGLEVLVNNAGLGMRVVNEAFTTQPIPFWQADRQAWRSIIDANVLGPFYMSHTAAPLMVAAGFGRLINVSTSPVTMVRRGYSPYGPSKSALEAMTRVWAQDLAGTGVTANAILPGGATDTDLIPGSGPGRRGSDGQLLPVTIMDSALLWLASDASSGINGRRVVGKLWDPTLPFDEAAEKAMPPQQELPSIL